MVLSYNDVKDYFDDPYYIGCTVGRYANRISGGSFPLVGEQARLSLNEPAKNNHLHGGFKGFNKRVWTVAGTSESDLGTELVLKLFSKHLEEGYPGNLEVELRYTLTDANQLILVYKASTSRPTIVNLTNHSYFNLSGGRQDISSHILGLKSDSYTPADQRYIPSGEILPVEGTSFDLQQARAVKDFMHEADTVNFCLENQRELQFAAVLTDPETGNSLEVSTTCPGLQLYCGNYLGGSFKPFSGICLEPHYYPDSPNHANFPSALLMPEETYDETTVYKFNSGSK
jgi:aldose 1-epimerase